jgi:hypothetical protein
MPFQDLQHKMELHPSVGVTGLGNLTMDSLSIGISVGILLIKILLKTDKILKKLFFKI